jgi:hypothetical protein
MPGKAGLRTRKKYFLPASNIARLSVTSPAEQRSAPATRGAAFIEQIALTKLGDDNE